MTVTEAKAWVRRYFATFDQHGGMEEFDTVLPLLCGCVDPLPKSLREEYPEAETYHDLWREVETDNVIEIEPPAVWVERLYPVFQRDAEVRGLPDSEAGFKAWLAEMVEPEDVAEAMEQWPA